jgi:hypothetical protein
MRTTAPASSGYRETGLHSCPGNRLFNVVTQPVCRLSHNIVENAFVCKTCLQIKCRVTLIHFSFFAFLSISLPLPPFFTLFSFRLPLHLSLFFIPILAPIPNLKSCPCVCQSMQSSQLSACRQIFVIIISNVILFP